MSSVGTDPFRNINFGERLTQARMRRHLSQEALAEAVGTTARSISRWEHNQAIPQQYYRERLCNALQITPEALFSSNEKRLQNTSPLWHVPYTRNAYFTGREPILSQIYEKLHVEHRGVPPQPYILSGLGGIGKTQLALEYAYHFRDHYQTVFWVGAETTETVMSGYRTLAYFLDLSEQERSDQISLREAVKRWFQSHGGWLLIFDNVEDLEMLTSMLPNAGQGHILITTRSQIMGTLGVRIELPKMELAEGTLFLLRRARLLAPGESLQEVSSHIQAQAETLVELLEGLPLALDQAGAYIEETACGLSGYLEHYSNRRTHMLNHRGSASSHHPASVTTTLSLSFQRVEQISPPAADLLRICAFLHAEAIPEELITQASETAGPVLQQFSRDPLLLDTAIRELRRFSLLDRTPNRKTLSMHRLLQAIIQDTMKEEERKLWTEHLLQAMRGIFPDYKNAATGHGPEALSRYQPYLSHALTCAEHIRIGNITSEEASDFLYRIGCFLQFLGNPSQALPLLLQAFQIAEKLFGAMHLTTIFYLNAVAIVYADAAKLDESEACFQQVLSARQRLLGPDHPEVAWSLWSLASVFLQKGRSTQALPLAQQALTMKEQALGPDHYEIAWVLNISGSIYTSQGEYAQAEACFIRGLHIYQKTVGMSHIFAASCLSNLGYLYAMQKRYDEAIRLCQQAVQIREEHLGKYNANLAIALLRLGYIYFDQEMLEQAEIAYQKAAEIFEKLLEPDPAHMACCLVALGEIHLTKGRLHLARHVLQQALGILGDSTPLEHTTYREVARCFYLVGDHLTSQGRVLQAQLCSQRAAAINKDDALSPGLLTIPDQETKKELPSDISQSPSA